MIDEFISGIEETFGKYKDGMRSIISERLANIQEDDFSELYRALTQNYDMARPPSLKVILGECYRNNIQLNHDILYGISVCEFCKQQFSQNVLKCPKCQKLRKYGITKLVRDRPKWIDRENAEDLKSKLEWEERTGRK